MASYEWSSACMSDVGLVRAVNEDACKEMPDNGIWVVADGMGGHEAGDLASAAVVSGLAGIERAERLPDLIEEVRHRLSSTNRYLVEEGAKRGLGVIGATVAVLVLFERHAVCIWAGDSRIYRLRDGRLRQLTRDHSWIEEYVSRGLMTREEADRHPLSNEITRAIGADQSLELAVEMRDLLPGDKFLICSDGLHGEVSDQEIERILVSKSLGDACRELVDAAKREGAHDNVTVIVVQSDAAQRETLQGEA